MAHGRCKTRVRHWRSNEEYNHTAMKTLGLIGGTGPESTIEYYRLLTEQYREKVDGHSPPIIINSIDLKQMIDWMSAGELGKVTDYLVTQFEILKRAGADFAALTANTPHI